MRYYIQAQALYNPLNYLETKEEVAQYLNDTYMGNDPKVFVLALGYMVKARGSRF